MRGEQHFTVRCTITGGAVRCYFGERGREEIALAAAGKRIVSVGGILHRDRPGRQASRRAPRLRAGRRRAMLG